MLHCRPSRHCTTCQTLNSMPKRRLMQSDPFIDIYHLFSLYNTLYFRLLLLSVIWRCISQPPFFGLVKMSMNRPPSKSDSWWQRHEGDCGDTQTTKTAEPEMTEELFMKLTAEEKAGWPRERSMVGSAKSASRRNGPLLELNVPSVQRVRRIADQRPHRHGARLTYA